jgi:hypothetical protein
LKKDKEGWDAWLLEAMEKKRDDPKLYGEFLKIFGPGTIGTANWKNNHQTCLLSEFVNVSDEAFLLLVLENNMEYWRTLAENQWSSSTDDGEVVKVKPPRWTSVYEKGESREGANVGWTEDGILRFNELIDEVWEDRTKHKGREDTEMDSTAEYEMMKIWKENKSKKTAATEKRKSMPKAKFMGSYFHL